MGGIDKRYFLRQGAQLKITHVKKYIAILSIQLLNYAYVILKQGFIKRTKLFKIPAFNCEPSVLNCDLPDYQNDNLPRQFSLISGYVIISGWLYT